MPQKDIMLEQSNLVYGGGPYVCESGEGGEGPLLLGQLRGLSRVCKLTMECTAETCTEKVSYANRLIIHALGLYDSKTK